MSDDFVTIDSNARTVAVDFAALPFQIRDRILTTLDRIGATLQRDVATTKITEGGILEPRTGNMRRALYYKVSGNSAYGAQVQIGVDSALVPYGAIQELGGTITPKTSAHLAIPMGEALTAKGVARFTAKELIANPFAFGFSGTFTAKDVIFGRIGSGADAQITALFALKDSVTLPARQYLQSTLEGRIDWILQQFQNLVPDTMGGA